VPPQFWFPPLPVAVGGSHCALAAAAPNSMIVAADPYTRASFPNRVGHSMERKEWVVWVVSSIAAIVFFMFSFLMWRTALTSGHFFGRLGLTPGGIPAEPPGGVREGKALPSAQSH
jgi:hypothetical protein